MSYIGISGWTYPDWRGSFYPKGLVQKKELHYASRQLSSIEINGTFYSLQRPSSFSKWYDETPQDFIFAVKCPQYITHIRRLKDVEEPLANFLASGLFCLREKLGPLLWQFPPNLTLKDDRFEKFLKLLPYDSKAAQRLAKKHTAKVEGRSETKVHGDFKIRHAFEFRHASFKNPAFIELLRSYGVAVVMGHSGLDRPYIEDVTADFVYARMHGLESKYKKGYPPKEIEWWAKRVKAWAAGGQPADAQTVSDKIPQKIKRDVFTYFDTEAKNYAPQDALKLRKLLG